MKLKETTVFKQAIYNSLHNNKSKYAREERTSYKDINVCFYDLDHERYKDIYKSLLTSKIKIKIKTSIINDIY